LSNETNQVLSQAVEAMGLINEVIEASGGLARWTGITQFTLHLSIDGELFAGRRGYRDMVADGLTQNQFVRFTGFSGPDILGLYQPQHVTLENQNGKTLRSWPMPKPFLLDHVHLDDDLQLVFICGVSLWNYLTTPFLLASPEIKVEELAPWKEQNQSWRRLRAVFPAHITTPAAEQIFYFDDKGRQRRADHDFFGIRSAHYSWAHQSFNDIVVPTLRQSLRLLPDGNTVRRPSLFDVEIFDATFE
jgi:hypothetical protein